MRLFFSFDLSPTMHDSITQIIDLMEGLRCSTLPLVCERIIEVQYRDWLLAPSLKKDGSFNQRQKSPGEENENDDSNDEEKGNTYLVLKNIPKCFLLFIIKYVLLTYITVSLLLFVI